MMNHSKAGSLIVLLLLVFFLSPHDVFANQAATTIEAPESAAKGSEITIRVKVTHSANAIFHHVQWVYVMVNGKEIARWSYSMFNLPKPDGKLLSIPLVFTKEIKYTVNGRCEIKAEASCNIHGSMGPATAQVSVKE
jgi:desulfoferrodoxin (superoxide reductase-like protein)